MAQIFISHSQHDSEIVTFFSSIFGKTNVKAVFFEYENSDPPHWPSIYNQIANSAALFVLLGHNVESLSHTKVWIGSEAGLATGLCKEVWVFENSFSPCNVPIPDTNHYMLYHFAKEFEEYIRVVVDSYDDVPVLRAALNGAIEGAMMVSDLQQPGASLGGAVVGSFFAANSAEQGKTRYLGIPFQCPYPDCQAFFNIHNNLNTGQMFPCPICRQIIYL